MPIISIEKAVELMKKSGVVGFPTETVYGLGAIATDRTAIKKVFLAKNRPPDNPLICHFDSIAHIKNNNIGLNKIAELLFTRFSPGPCSILLNLPKASDLNYATAGQPKIICRIPDHPLTIELIKKLGRPIVGPSANISGRPSGTSASIVLESFGENIDGVIDGGESKIGLESTIVDIISDEEIKILRPGAIGKVELEELFKDSNIPVKIVENEFSHTIIPGAKYPHYSPATKVIQINNLTQITEEGNYAIIASSERIKNFNINEDIQKKVVVVNLGSKGNLKDVSHNLYANLFSIDRLNISLCYLLKENWGQSSLAIAIENRLEKVGISKV